MNNLKFFNWHCLLIPPYSHSQINSKEYSKLLKLFIIIPILGFLYGCASLFEERPVQYYTEPQKPELTHTEEPQEPELTHTEEPQEPELTHTEEPQEPEPTYTEEPQELEFQVKMVAPLETQTFPLPSKDEGLIGQLQSVLIQSKEVFADLARQFNLGFDEIGLANPEIDPWLPKVGTKVILPTQHILPQAPRIGLVLNISAKRLYYYLPQENKVITYPIGVGRKGWATPLGLTKIVSKKANPTWEVPKSIRKEHAKAGDPLPAVVPPGPDNPLGKYALRLSKRSYLIHGTNKPPGVGMQVSHGCIRLYPESIENLYKQVPKGTQVNIVNQPYLVTWHNKMLYLEVHPQLPGYPKVKRKSFKKLLTKIAGDTASQINWTYVETMLDKPLGIPFPILKNAPTKEEVLKAAPLVYHATETPIDNLQETKPDDITSIP